MSQKMQRRAAGNKGPAPAFKMKMNLRLQSNIVEEDEEE
jgi:hypothetical protein